VISQIVVGIGGVLVLMLVVCYLLTDRPPEERWYETTYRILIVVLVLGAAFSLFLQSPGLV